METKANIKSWFIWGIAALFYLYELALRVSPSVMTNELMASYNATSTMFGVLVSFYYYAYTMLQLPCGVILDKLGPRNLLGLSTILCVAGSFMFAASSEIYLAQVGRFLVGAGSACAFISCLQIATFLFPKEYFVVIAGITNMMGTIGGLLGGLPIAKSVNKIGWQNTTYILAIIGLFLAILIFLFIPKTLSNKNRNQKSIPIVLSIWRLLKNSQVVLSGIIAGFMYLPVSAFAELWAVPFFMTKYSINNEKASIASAIMFIGVASGSVLLAIFARKINSYMKTIRYSSIGIAIAFLPIIYLPIGIYGSFFFVFIIGFLTGGQVINFTCAKNNADASISGTTLALTNAIVMLIGSIFQPILGVFIDLFWNGKFSETGLRIYDIGCYQKAILTLPICVGIAYLLSLFVKETIHIEK